MDELGNIELSMLYNIFGSLDIEFANKTLEFADADSDEFVEWLKGREDIDLLRGGIDINLAVFEFLIDKIDATTNVTEYLVEIAQKHLCTNFTQTQIKHDLFNDTDFRKLLMENVDGMIEDEPELEAMDNSELMSTVMRQYPEMDAPVVKWVCTEMGLRIK